MSSKASKQQLCDLGYTYKKNNDGCLSNPQKTTPSTKTDTSFNKNTISKAMLYSQMVRNINQIYDKSQTVSTYRTCSTSRTVIPVNSYSRATTPQEDAIYSSPTNVLPFVITNFQIDASFTDISNNSMTIFWVGIGCDVNVEYYDEKNPDNKTTLYHISNHSFTINSLEKNTTYIIRLRPTFNGLYGVLFTITGKTTNI
jgi:hypothetical protein